MELLAYKGLLSEVRENLQKVRSLDSDIAKKIKSGFYPFGQILKQAHEISIRAASQIEQGELLEESYLEKIKELSS